MVFKYHRLDGKNPKSTQSSPALFPPDPQQNHQSQQQQHPSTHLAQEPNSTGTLYNTLHSSLASAAAPQGIAVPPLAEVGWPDLGQAEEEGSFHHITPENPAYFTTYLNLPENAGVVNTTALVASHPTPHVPLREQLTLQGNHHHHHHHHNVNNNQQQFNHPSTQPSPQDLLLDKIEYALLHNSTDTAGLEQIMALLAARRAAAAAPAPPPPPSLPPSSTMTGARVGVSDAMVAPSALVTQAVSQPFDQRLQSLEQEQQDILEYALRGPIPTTTASHGRRNNQSQAMAEQPFVAMQLDEDQGMMMFPVPEDLTVYAAVLPGGGGGLGGSFSPPAQPLINNASAALEHGGQNSMAGHLVSMTSMDDYHHHLHQLQFSNLDFSSGQYGNHGGLYMHTTSLPATTAPQTFPSYSGAFSELQYHQSYQQQQRQQSMVFPVPTSTPTSNYSTSPIMNSSSSSSSSMPQSLPAQHQQQQRHLSPVSQMSHTFGDMTYHSSPQPQSQQTQESAGMMDFVPSGVSFSQSTPPPTAAPLVSTGLAQNHTVGSSVAKPSLQPSTFRAAAKRLSQSASSATGIVFRGSNAPPTTPPSVREEGSLIPSALASPVASPSKRNNNKKHHHHHHHHRQTAALKSGPETPGSNSDSGHASGSGNTGGSSSTVVTSPPSPSTPGTSPATRATATAVSAPTTLPARHSRRTSPRGSHPRDQDRHTRPYACEICKRTYTRAWNRDVHVKAHGEPHIKCLHPECENVYRRLHDMKRHYLVHRIEEGTLGSGGVGGGEGEGSIKGKIPHECVICKVGCRRNDALWRHYDTYHPGDERVPKRKVKEQRSGGGAAAAGGMAGADVDAGASSSSSSSSSLASAAFALALASSVPESVKKVDVRGKGRKVEAVDQEESDGLSSALSSLAGSEEEDEDEEDEDMDADGSDED